MSHPRLPFDLTSFVGRAAELEQLAALLEHARLITLTGGPGSGKTRLALELARRESDAGRAVAWTELAALRDPGLVVPAAAEALGVVEEVRTGDTVSLARILGDRPVLLVLDNCEHLLDGAAELVDGLLPACPGLSILATSRQALGVRGERAWLVPPLSLPGPGAVGLVDGRGSAEAPAGEGSGAEAVRLFVERAREVVPEFELTPEHAPVVEEICRRLEGIPLAIELAAARIRLLPPAAMLERLEDVLGLPPGERRLAPRHRTLRSAIDWSYDLLGERTRTVLHRIAVFRGGFTLDAAERVAAGGEIAAGDVLELVGRLVDQSLLVVRERNGFARYHVLEAVRQYALERLAAADEEEATRRRHALHVCAVVEEAAPRLTGPERLAWTDRLQAEIDNVRSALAWTRTREPGLHVRLAAGLWWFWFSTQHWTEGGGWIDGALALPEAGSPGPDRAMLLFASGALAALQVRSADARPALEQAIALGTELGDERLVAYATNYLGLTWAGEGDPRGGELCRQAERWFRAHDDLYGLRLALLLQGSTALAAGELDEAERLNREGVEVARRFGLGRELAISLQNLAVVYIVQGRLDEAEARIREALRTGRNDVSHYFTATGVGYLGEIEGRRGNDAGAARLLGAAEGLRDVVGARPFPLDGRRIEALVPRLRERLGADAFREAWAEGRGLHPETLIRELVGTRPTPTAPPVEASDAEAASSSTHAADRNAGATSGTVSGLGEQADLEDHADAEPRSGDPTATAPRPPAPALVVDALGGFRVQVDGAPVEDAAWPYAKPRELLVYLLLHPGGRSRDQVGDALWPEATDARAKNSFHVTLHHLRKALGHPEW
ncbi:MAG TPA: hypothetical protein VK858_13345, partial [Longimicrobiales bacterium]|nr:hypothetical protein [Longimicrobiales bacterium]